jgi:hypothetical protein
MKITRKTLLKTLTAGLITIPSFGKRQIEKDFLGYKAEFTDAWKRSEEYTLTVFNQMPEEKLEFRYTPESFSFRTQFVHCITFTAVQLCGRLNIPNPYEKIPPSFWAKLSKADLDTELHKFYAWVLKVMNETKPETLIKPEDYAGGTIQMWRFFYAMENHIIHHRGQAICYLRLNEVIPEGYVGW